ncbi:MAG: hypothetical protein B5766_06940 [Candidatus Lumbricidophila eiseniae]|uniref:ABM domain-containing protein n=1 Tax=Candidatus Lumbricidiphila eiseniae TaxID=1969409 RepID=A0A2A6FRU0_9MICO|nr:MAG: hypothetical protein B5766_06940 [Candidatus Lumbricidophila eiseniae]
MKLQILNQTPHATGDNLSSLRKVSHTMIRTILTLQVAPERVRALLGFYETEKILQKSIDMSGAVAGEFAVSTDGSGTILVTALWPDRAAYDAWLANEFRAESNGRMAALLEDDAVGVGQSFEILHEVFGA